jgi:hypothetical protein
MYTNRSSDLCYNNYVVYIEILKQIVVELI